jgi:hypothetical protein
VGPTPDPRLIRVRLASTSLPSIRAVLPLVAALLAIPSVLAQLAVTQITTTYNAVGGSDTINGSSFDRDTQSITTFKDAAGNIYDANTVAGTAYVRRNTGAGNANNSSVWYAQDGDGSQDFAASYATSYSTLLLGNNILRGSDNTFANGSGDVAAGNIERLDFLFSSSGINSSVSTSFAIFDRGLASQHDYVKIAVITGWDSATQRPTAYGGNLVSITTAHYGTTNPIGNFDYNLFRYDSGDNFGNPYWDNNSETGTQGIGGVVISMADLGIAAGTKIYGYSLMGYDVTNGGSMANLVDWSNATYYKTDTTGETGTGGIDLSAVNGVLYNRRVPEPSTYGAIFVGLTAVALGVRRRFRRLTARAA